MILYWYCMNLCTLFTKHLPFNNTTHLRRRPAILQDFQLSERGSRPSSTPRSKHRFQRQDSEAYDIVKEATIYGYLWNQRRICIYWIYYACGFEGRKESAGDLHNGKPATEITEEVQNSALSRPMSCASHVILPSPGYASETALQCEKPIQTCPQNTRLPEFRCASFVWLCLYLFGAEGSSVKYRMLTEKTTRS